MYKIIYPTSPITSTSPQEGYSNSWVANNTEWLTDDYLRGKRFIVPADARIDGVE